MPRFPTIKEQQKFEKRLFRKTVKKDSEIVMLDGMTILYKSSVDLFFYVMVRSTKCTRTEICKF